jgi:hypothetical protein
MSLTQFPALDGRQGEAVPIVRWREGLLALAGFVTVAVTYLRLTFDRFLGAIAPDPGDPLFNLAILRWGASQARLGFPDFWNPTFFFPTRGALALSDHLIGPGIALGLLEAVGFPPAAGYNLLLLAGLAGGAFSCFLVLRWSGLGTAGAAMGALAWSFTASRWAELSHLQVLLTLWVPLVLWSFDRLLAEPSRRHVLHFVGFYALHISGGAYLAYLIHLPLAAIFVVRNHGRWRDLLARGSRAGTAHQAAAFAACAGLYLAMYLPYVKLRSELGAAAGFELVRPFLVHLAAWFRVGPRTVYAGALPEFLRSDTVALFVGLVPGVLALFGLVAWIGHRRQPGRAVSARDRGLAAFSVLAALTALGLADAAASGLAGIDRREFSALRATSFASAAVALLSFALWQLVARRWRRNGPAERTDRQTWWTGLLTAGLFAGFAAHTSGMMILRALLPGFDTIRVPGRLFVFSGFALAALAGAGLDALLSRSRSPLSRRAAIAFLFAFALVELAPAGSTIEWVALPVGEALPPAYRWLAEHDEVEAVIELPMLEYWRETPRLYFWSFHLRPLVNGYSGYLPRGYLERKDRFSGPLDARDLEALADLGVSHLLVHLDQIPGRQQRRQFTHTLQEAGQPGEPVLRTVFRADRTVVLEIARPSTRGLPSPAPAGSK